MIGMIMGNDTLRSDNPFQTETFDAENKTNLHVEL